MTIRRIRCELARVVVLLGHASTPLCSAAPLDYKASQGCENLPINPVSLTLHLHQTGTETDFQSRNKESSANYFTNLQSLETHVQAVLSTEDRPINIVVSGQMFNQSIKWSTFSPVFPIRFMSADKTRATFDGRSSPFKTLGSQKEFFRFNFKEAKQRLESSRQCRLKPGEIKTRLQFENLNIEYYREGITISGMREPDDSGHWNFYHITDNLIRSCHFSKIGERFFSSAKPNQPGFSIIRLLMSNKNVIVDNVFENAANASGSLQHAVYLADSSSRNLVEGNTFSDLSSGSAIKIRNYSNENFIRSNTFKRVTKGSAIEQWHCNILERGTKSSPNAAAGFPVDKACSQDGIKSPPECPSWGTLVGKNHFGDVGTLLSYQDAEHPSICMLNSKLKLKHPPLPLESPYPYLILGQ